MAGATEENGWQLRAEIVIRVFHRRDEVRVEIEADPEKVRFEDLMCATEFLIATTARQSDAGFEKALELLQNGAMTYTGGG